MTPLRRILSYAFLTTLILISNALTASADSNRKAVEEEKDTLPAFRGGAVSYDIAGTIMRMVSDYGQYETALRLNFKDRYFPIVEVGMGDAKHTEDAVTGIAAKVRAPYGRIGCDFNVAKHKHDAYRVMVGARYGFTSFKTEASANAEDPYWGDKTAFAVNTKRCKYHWMELCFTVDGHLWGPVRMGWSVRYRRKLKSSDIGANQLWYVPGFGKEGNKIGATFNIAVELWKHQKKSDKL